MRTMFSCLFLGALLVFGAAAQPPRVGGLALDAPPFISGSCQAGTRVHFTGRINATGPLVVTYEWLRSDHASSPVRTLRFTRRGPLTITNNWVVRGPASGWMAFRILSPTQIESRKVEFRVNCR